ncbi:MAG TPA: porin [Polyangiaceae bacterium]
MLTPRITLAAPLLFAAGPLFAQPLAPVSPAAPEVQPAPTEPAPPSGAAAAPDAPPMSGTPAPAAPPEAEVSTPLATPSEAGEKPEPEFPGKLAIGKGLLGTWQPSALLQFWLYAAREDGETTTTPRVRRAELRMKGEIVPDLVKFAVMIDPAKSLFSSRELEVEGTEQDPPPTVTVVQPGSDRSILQDLILTFTSEYADVSLGAYKNPVSLEGTGSSSQLLFPERARVSRHYGDRRDLGVKAEKKLGDVFYYNVGVYSGSGINTADEDNEKDLGVRLEAYPIPGLTVAAVGYTTIGERDENVRDRLEGDLRYDQHGVIFQAEYIHGWDGVNRVEGHGAYAALGYTVLERVQPIVRIGFLDSNLDEDEEVDPDAGTQYDGTINYYLRSNEARLSLAVSVLDRPDLPNLTELFFLTQVSF